MAARRLSCLARNGSQTQGKKVGADAVAARDQAAKPSPANQSHCRGGIGLGSDLSRELWQLPDFQYRSSIKGPSLLRTVSDRHGISRHRQRTCATLVSDRDPRHRLATGQHRKGGEVPVAHEPELRPNRTNPEQAGQDCPLITTPASYRLNWLCQPRPALAGRGLESDEAIGGRGSIASRKQAR
jgi:hypothetical protein